MMKPVLGLIALASFAATACFAEPAAYTVTETTVIENSRTYFPERTAYATFEAPVYVYPAGWDPLKPYAFFPDTGVVCQKIPFQIAKTNVFMKQKRCWQAADPVVPTHW